MGSFGGVNIVADNFQQTVELAQEKASLLRDALEKNRIETISQSLANYRDGLTQTISVTPRVNSEKLLRTNVTGVLNQDVPYNLLLTVSEQEANRIAYDKYKIEAEKQRILDLQAQQAGSNQIFTKMPFFGNTLPYKQGGILKVGTKVQGDLYAQDLRPVDGQYNEWVKVKVPNSFGGVVNVDSKFINYDTVTASLSDKQDKDHKVKLIVIGAFVLGLLLSND